VRTPNIGNRYRSAHEPGEKQQAQRAIQKSHCREGVAQKPGKREIGGEVIHDLASCYQTFLRPYHTTHHIDKKTLTFFLPQVSERPEPKPILGQMIICSSGGESQFNMSRRFGFAYEFRAILAAAPTLFPPAFFTGLGAIYDLFVSDRTSLEINCDLHIALI